jgi:glycosyltransferase involved in cell wall biosynthesis
VLVSGSGLNAQKVVRVKIAMVSIATGERRSLGGNLIALCRELGTRGHEVVIHGASEGTIVPGVSGRWLSGPFADDTELLKKLNSLGSELAAEWRRRRPDIVHADTWLSGLAALAGIRAMRHGTASDGVGMAPEEGAPLPLVYTFHRPVRPGDRTRRRLETALVRSAALTVAADEDAADAIIRLGVLRRRVAVIPSGVDLERFTPNGPAAQRGGVARLVTVGELVPSSGFETAIAALPRVPEAELLIAGQGEPDPETTRLSAGARALGVAERVHFVGSTSADRLPALLRSADAVVHVPWQGMGSAVPLAAMACGVPVVASEVSGAADVVVHGVTGLCVPPRRPDELAVALRGLLADPVRSMGFGVAGTDRVRSRYTWSRAADELVRAYRVLLPVEAVEPVAAAEEAEELELTD